MATFTTQRAGNWSNSSENPTSPWYDNSTQSGLARVPTSGDTVVHSFNGLLTVDTSQSIGTGTGTAITMSGGSSCRILLNANLTVDGDWIHNQTIASLQANPTVDIAAGITLTFEATGGRRVWQLMSANSQYTWIRTNGTSISPCTITATGGDFYFSRVSFIVGGYYDFLYTTISNCYDGTRYAYNPWSGNVGGYHKIINCTLSNSGEWNLAGTPHINSIINFGNTFFNNTRGTYSLYFSGNATAYEQIGCVFMKQVGMPNQSNVTWNKCYFHTIPEVSGTSFSGNIIENSFIRKQSNSPLVLNVPPTFRNNYVYYDDAANTDPHILQSGTATFTYNITQNVIEANCNSNSQGDVIDANSNGTGIRNITYNLVLKCLLGTTSSGFLLGLLGAASQTYNIEHNTVVGALSTTPIYMGDAYNPHTGMIGSLQSNIFGNDNSTTRPLVWNTYNGGVNNPNDNVITTISKNNVYGGRDVTNTGVMSPANGTYNKDLKASSGTYYGTPQTTNPESTDLQILPNFVDSTRNLTTWSVVRGYASSGQTQAQKESAAYTALQNNPLSVIEDLYDWVREGFYTTNPEFLGTAHDGGDIGALPVIVSGSEWENSSMNMRIHNSLV